MGLFFLFIFDALRLQIIKRLQYYFRAASLFITAITPIFIKFEMNLNFDLMSFYFKKGFSGREYNLRLAAAHKMDDAHL